MSKSVSRRTLMQGIAAATAAASAPTAAIAAPTSSDPIFAAIERHISAVNHELACCDVTGGMFSKDPGYKDALDRTCAAHDGQSDAAVDLTCIVPTTLAGVMALLAHIDRVNRGMYKGTGVGSYTEHQQWPDDLWEEGFVNPRGKVIEMPFPYWILRSVHAALEAGVS